MADVLYWLLDHFYYCRWGSLLADSVLGKQMAFVMLIDFDTQVVSLRENCDLDIS